MPYLGKLNVNLSKWKKRRKKKNQVSVTWLETLEATGVFFFMVGGETLRCRSADLILLVKLFLPLSSWFSWGSEFLWSSAIEDGLDVPFLGIHLLSSYLVDTNFSLLANRSKKGFPAYISPSNRYCKNAPNGVVVCMDFIRNIAYLYTPAGYLCNHT